MTMCNAGIAVLIMLAICALLVALKLFGIATYAWWVVLVPLAPIPIAGAICVIVFVWAILSWMADGCH